MIWLAVVGVMALSFLASYTAVVGLDALLRRAEMKRTRRQRR